MTYDLKKIEENLSKLSSHAEKINYISSCLFNRRKKYSEYLAFNELKLGRLKLKTADDFDKYHSELEKGKLVYWSNNNRDEIHAKRMGIKNVELLKERLNLEYNIQNLKGQISLFEGLLEKVQIEADSSKTHNKIEYSSYQPEFPIYLESGKPNVDSDFNILYSQIRYKSATPFLQAKTKDYFDRIIIYHAGYKRQIIERLLFALKDWIVYQKEKGALNESNKEANMGYKNAKGAVDFYNWLLLKSDKLNEIESHTNLEDLDIAKSANKKSSSQAHYEANSEIKLNQFFVSKSKFKSFMKMLASNGKIEPSTYLWIDDANGSKGYLAGLLKDLHGKGYYENNKRLTNNEIQKISFNTFGWDISIDTIKKATPEKFDFNFIPLASALD